MSTTDDILNELERLQGDANQTFWQFFGGTYPPRNWDAALDHLRARVRPELAEAVDQAGIDLGLYAPGDMYPGGRTENDFAVWASGDGYWTSLYRHDRRLYDTITDEEWGVLNDFTGEIEEAVMAEAKRDGDWRAFVEAVGQYDAQMQE